MMTDYSPTQSVFGPMLRRCDVGIDAGSATWDDVAGVTVRLPLTQTCRCLSSLAELAAHPEGLIRAQADIVRWVEPTSLRAAVAARLQSDHGTGLVWPPQLVAAWRELALHGSPATDGSFDDLVIRELFWQWLMMITEALGSEEEGRLDKARRLADGEPSLTSDFAQSLTATGSYLTSRDRPQLLMARHYELLDRTLQSAEIRASGNWVDLGAEIEQLVGCQWRTYHAIGCILGMVALAPKGDTAVESLAVQASSPDTFPAPALDRAMLRQIFEEISFDLPQLRTRYEKLGLTDEWRPDPLPLQERPLVHLPDGSYRVSLPQFVVERFTVGVYYDLWNAWKAETGQPSNQFTAFWGELLEAYVDSLFLPIFPHSGQFKRLWVDEELLYDGSRPSDVLLDCGEVLVLVEVTHSRFTRQSLVAGDPMKIREDINKALIAKAHELHSVIGDFRNGKFGLGGRGSSAFRRLLPVIVLWHDVPVFEPALRHFHSELTSKGLLQGPDILSPRVLLLQECEGLLAAVHAGDDFRCALEDARWNTRGESFGSFRHRVGRPLSSLQHPVLKSAIERLRESIRASLFGGAA